MSNSSDLKSLARAAQSAGVILTVVVLYTAQDVLIPLALGLLFAFLLAPLVNRLQRWGMPNMAAVLATAVVVFGLVAVIGWITWSGVADLMTELPKYKSELKEKLSSLRTYSQGVGKFVTEFEEMGKAAPPEDQTQSPVATEDSADEQQSSETNSSTELSSNGEEELVETGVLRQSAIDGGETLGATFDAPIYVREAPSVDATMRVWAGGLGALFGPLGTIGLVVVFALFLLIYRDDLRDRLVAVISRGNYVVTTEALQEAGERVGRYLLAQLILNATFGFVFALGLMLIGYLFGPENIFPKAVVLGLVAGLVRFVPYIGPIVGAGVSMLVAFASIPGYNALAAVAVLILVMELVSNNVVEPWLYGTSTGVSSIAVILAAVFWGWLWGPVGLLLATPLTTCLVVLGRHVPRFQFLATLLSDQQRIKPAIRLYQRLLTGNEFKLVELLNEEEKTRQPAEFLDEVIVPTLRQILDDNQTRAASELQLTELLAAGLSQTNLALQELAAVAETESADEPNLPLVYGIAARHSAEALLLHLLGNQLNEVCRFEVLDTPDLPDRAVINVIATEPSMVAVLALPGHGFSQALFWCRSLRANGYHGPLYVIAPGRYKYLDMLLLRFRRAGATTVLTSLRRAIRKSSNGLQRKPVALRVVPSTVGT